MASALSNHYKHELHNGNIDFANHQFKITLMASGFTFDPDAHAGWSDASASELSGGSGYTAGGAILQNVQISEDDTFNRSDVTWDNAQWTANGGDIGPAVGAVIYDASHASNCIVGYIDFGSDRTATDGLPFTISTITVRLE